MNVNGTESCSDAIFIYLFGISSETLCIFNSENNFDTRDSVTVDITKLDIVELCMYTVGSELL